MRVTAQLTRMNADELSRRDFFTGSLAFSAPALLAAVALPAAAAEPNDAGSRRTLSVVCVGAHPDDPESGCAGTFARYALLGHLVTNIYLTRGERGIKGKSDAEAAAIRSTECVAACQIIGATPVFAGQIDGSAEMTRARADEMLKLLSAESPDLLFTHWPMDTHFDHQVASMLAIRAYLAMQKRPQLYFFEVNTGSQSQNFLPNCYVDITAVAEKKKQALLAHVSQDGAGIWRQHHEPVALFRGREAGVGMAEAFVHLMRDSQRSPLPGLAG